jgi:hypothetical protein
MRFRKRKFVFTMDVSKMFLRISLGEGRDCLRWVWRNCDKEKAFKIFRMIVVTFGIITSPFKACWVVQEMARMFKKDLPRGIEILTKEFCMDNRSSGSDEKPEVQLQTVEVQELLERAGIPTQKWAASSLDLLNKIPKELWSKENKLSIFGVMWDSENDSIVMKVTEPPKLDAKVETKRTVLQTIARLFDPIGLFSPFILTSKLLFQK